MHLDMKIKEHYKYLFQNLNILKCIDKKRHDEK